MGFVMSLLCFFFCVQGGNDYEIYESERTVGHTGMLYNIVLNAYTIFVLWNRPNYFFTISEVIDRCFFFCIRSNALHLVCSLIIKACVAA